MASRSVEPFCSTITSVTDRQTDHATRSVTTGRIYVRSTAMRPNPSICNHCGVMAAWSRKTLLTDRDVFYCIVFLCPPVVMGHYILQLWFLSFFFFLFLSFLAYSQRSEIGCLSYFHTWCGLSANLECMSEMCCTRLAENTGRKHYAKNRHLRTIAELLWGYIFATKAYINSRKKLLNSISPQHVLTIWWTSAH